jgi:hypothetical protein
LLVAVGEFLVALVDLSGLNRIAVFVLFIEFCDGLMKQLMVRCELVEDLCSVSLTGLLLDVLNCVFGEHGVCFFCGCFQPLES